jgi:AcrR family transcriptional regulator
MFVLDVPTSTREQGAAMPRRTPVEPRKTPKQRRAQDTVDAIVEAATRICREQGYEATNVNEVARVAGVSVGSLYQYFPSKEALVAEIGRRLGVKMLDVFQEGIAELAFVPLEQAVAGIIKNLIAAFAVDPPLRNALAEVPSAVRAIDVPDFDDMLADALTAYFEFHRDTIRPTNHRLAARLLQTAVEPVALRVTLDGFEGTDRDEVERELAALVLGYLGKR